MKHLSLLILLILFSCTKDPVMYDVTISATEGGIVSPQSGSFEEGSSVKYTATPSAEYEFTKWSNGSTQNPLVLTVTSDLSIQAEFSKKQYELTIIKEGEGAVNERIINSGKGYDSGTKIELTAVPAGEWVFAGWSGDVTSTDNPLQVTISSPKNIKAKFVRKMYPQVIYNSSTLNHEWNDGWVTFKTQRIESEFWSAFTYFDYNLDGKMDVFFRGWTSDNSNPLGVNIMTDSGWKNVPNVVDFQPGIGYRKIVTADIDNDGDLDMICFLAEDPGQSKQNGNRIMGGLDIYRFKDGKFYYEEVVPYQEGMKFYLHGGVVGDINGDGWVDILASGTSGAKVFMNKKDGTFDTNYFEVTQMTDSNPSPGSSTFTLELADLNNDGFLDLMTGLARNGFYFPQNQPSEYPKYNYTSHIYFGKSEYPYFVDIPLVLDTDFAKSTPEEMKYSFNITYDYVVSDMDKDGDLDLFVFVTNDDALYNPGDLNYKNDAALEYHENNGDSTFTLKNDIFVSGQNIFDTGGNWFKAWDVNGDGKKEILVETYDRLGFNAWKQNTDGKYYQTIINY